MPTANNRYYDIINMPRPICERKKHMSQSDRAIQFASFAALSGHDAAIKETARLTDNRPEPDDDRKNKINNRLQILLDRAYERPVVSVTYFLPDKLKSGGEFVTFEGAFRTLDGYTPDLVFTDRTRISLRDIYNIEGEIFPEI